MVDSSFRARRNIISTGQMHLSLSLTRVYYIYVEKREKAVCKFGPSNQ